MIRFDAVGSRCQGPRNGQVGLRQLQTWTLATYGGQSLGIYNCRPVRGGSGLSTHAEGRSFDWAAPNRGTLVRYFETLIAHADELNIQAIHDYGLSLRWQTGRGWYRASIGTGTNRQTHVERNWIGARDVRPIAEIIRATPIPVPASMPAPALEDEEVLIVQPGKGSPSRTATHRLDRAGRQIVSYNRGALGGDIAFFNARVRKLREIPADAPIVGFFAAADGRGIVVQAQLADGAAADYFYDFT